MQKKKVRLVAGVGVSVTNDMTGTEQNTNGQIRKSAKDTHTPHMSFGSRSNVG